MRVIKNTEKELVISAFSRGLFLLTLVLASVIGFGVYTSLQKGTLFFLYIMAPIIILCAIFGFVLMLTTSRATFSRRRGKVILLTRNIFWRERRVFPLDFFRHAKVHTLQGDDLQWEVVLVFNQRIMFDPEAFDAEALEKHKHQSAQAGRAPHEISMTAGSDSVFSFERKERIVRAINKWARANPAD